MPHVRRPPPAWLALLQYAAVRSVTAAVCALPFRGALAAAQGIAAVVRVIDRKHFLAALRNVDASFPEMPLARRRALVRGVYDHLAVMFVEILFAARLIRRGNVAQFVRLRNTDVLDRVLAAGRGGIAVIGHLGNWEVGGVGFALLGYPLHSIARPLDNPYLERYLNRFRTQTGQGIAAKYNVLHQLGELLGKNKVVVFLADQDARRHGMFVPFFGRPASTVKAPAVMALRLGVPLVPVNVYREGGPMRMVVDIRPPLTVPPGLEGEAAVRHLVEGYTRVIEGFIRQHPEQWLWLHRRWKTKPPAEAAIR